MTPNFLALRAGMTRGWGRVLFFAFDLLHLDGFDVRAAPLADRRGVLKQLLANEPGGRILMSETIDLEEPPELLFRHACDLGLEGIVAKRPDTIWVEPRVIADIAFTELTEDGMLRHA